MNVFIWEALSAGAMGFESPSLLREGRAMLEALVTDICAIDRASIATIVDERAGFARFPSLERLRVVSPNDARDEQRLFRQLAAEYDHCWIIAPEIDGLLPERIRLAESVGGRVVGPSADAATLCGDKLALAGHLAEHGIATIETLPVTAAAPEFQSVDRSFPCVLKPRHGAGSLGCRRVDDTAMWRDAIADAGPSESIVQPFIAGEPISIAAIIDPEHKSIERLPVARQLLSDDGRCAYLGGIIDGNQPVPDAVARLVDDACRTLPGLSGYAGFDLIVPEARPDEVVLVEINPRLTTSYIGYRRLTNENLAERILRPAALRPPVAWNQTSVKYFPDGRVVGN